MLPSKHITTWETFEPRLKKEEREKKKTGKKTAKHFVLKELAIVLWNAYTGE